MKVTGQTGWTKNYLIPGTCQASQSLFKHFGFQRMCVNTQIYCVL